MRLVVVGNSIAADCLLAAIQRHTPPADLSITVIGEEPHTAYNRVALSQLLSGELDQAAIRLRDDSWYAQHKITTRLGRQVVSIDRADGAVELDSGERIPYDKLVLATGARARLPAGTTLADERIEVFRTLDDARSLIDTSPGDHTVVLGGGLLGIEAAAGLLARGGSVTLVHRNGWLLNRQLDRPAGELLASSLRARGLAITLDAEVSAIEHRGARCIVHLNNGTLLEAQRVVCATGIEPRCELARDAQLEVNRGIVVDPYLRTSDPRVFALGECAECAGETVGLVPPIRDHASVLAKALCGHPGTPYRRRDHAVQLKVAGIDVFSAGDINAASEQSIIFDDPLTPARRILSLQDGRIKAIMLYGDTRDGPWLNALLQAQTDTRACHDRLIFGRAYCAGLAA